MNIDIINKILSRKYKIPEEKVELITKYYWKCIHDHLYDYNHLPINIEGICVLEANAFLIKREILKYISKLRGNINSKRFIIGSEKYNIYIENLKKQLRFYLKLRKDNGYTN